MLYGYFFDETCIMHAKHVITGYIVLRYVEGSSEYVVGWCKSCMFVSVPLPTEIACSRLTNFNSFCTTQCKSNTTGMTYNADWGMWSPVFFFLWVLTYNAIRGLVFFPFGSWRHAIAGVLGCLLRRLWIPLIFVICFQRLIVIFFFAVKNKRWLRYCAGSSRFYFCDVSGGLRIKLSIQKSVDRTWIADKIISTEVSWSNIDSHMHRLFNRLFIFACPNINFEMFQNTCTLWRG